MRTYRGIAALLATWTLAALALGGCATEQKLPEAPPIIDPRGAQSMGDMEKAISVLQEASHHANAGVRANVMEAVQPLKDERAVAVLEAGIREHSTSGDVTTDPWVVRFAAVMTAGKRMETSLRPLIQQLFPDEINDNVRVAMVYALKRMGDDSHMNLLMRSLSSTNPDVRANTAMVLGLLGDPSAIAVLRQDRGDPDWRVKFEIKAAMARLGDDEAVHAIVAMALSSVVEEQWNSLQLCGDLPQEIATSTLKIGLRPNWKLEDTPYAQNLRRNLIAARGLGKKGINEEGKSGRWVMIFLNADDPTLRDEPALRALAALALGDILKPGQQAPLVPLLNDQNPQVRVAAAAAIVNMLSKPR